MLAITDRRSYQLQLLPTAESTTRPLQGQLGLRAWVGMPLHERLLSYKKWVAAQPRPAAPGIGCCICRNLCSCTLQFCAFLILLADRAWPLPQRRFFIFLAYLALLHQMGTALFRLMGALGREISRTNVFGSFALVLLILLGGFALKRPDIVSAAGVICDRVSTCASTIDVGAAAADSVRSAQCACLVVAGMC
jgi:hypothetical protein